jgi:hypothetical protein
VLSPASRRLWQTPPVAQPEYVPVIPSERVRKEDRLPPSVEWRADRPADMKGPARAAGTHLGTTGPDLGYGLKLARRFADRLELTDGISADDATAGCFAVGTKRSALFGRAPVIYDFELAFTLWGFLGGAPADLVEARRPLFSGCSHHYWDQRGIADAVPEATLRLTPKDVRDRLPSWRSLLVL